MKKQLFCSALVLLAIGFHKIEAGWGPAMVEEIISAPVQPDAQPDMQPGEAECLMGIRCFMDPIPKESEGCQYFQTAVEKGFVKAYSLLADCYLSGRGVAKNESHGIGLLRLGAAFGDTNAQFTFGLYTKLGLIVDQDYAAGYRWLKKAADGGHKNAQCNVAMCYELGQGVEQNEKEAFFWYKKAAEQGHPYARYKLGTLYEEGRGVEQDIHEAVKWYKLAADQGNADAKKKLEILLG
ncbi:MAG TPA: tetratricopeptide repeat protein [Rhabdochlamydiaceae bacterium]|jgi:hypothetical protein|nr:tetratricopeptide repeat protein [Rhabdochlamydiaceae bacterium]